MEAIQNSALETYHKNLEYFSKEHKDLFNILNIFEMALNKNDFTPTLDLEYVDGYFDVKNLQTDKYLYSSNSQSVSKELVKLVNFKKNSFAFEGFPIYNFSDEALKNSTSSIKTIDGVLPIMKYYFHNSKENDTMREIEKFILVGTGLGLHIPLVNEKISAQEYLIIEDNIELFKLSLFTTKYYELAKNASLYFSIADDENKFLQTISIFLESNFFNNRYLKYLKFPTHSDDKIKQIQNAITTQSFIFFPYKANLFKSIKPLEYLNDGYNLLNISTNFSDSLFYDKPVLLIAAGPSFKKNITWIKQNHKKFIIIAASAILNTLYEYKITPDIVTHLDGDDISAGHFKNSKDTDFLSKSIMLFGPNTPTIVRNMFNKNQIFYYDEGTEYVKNNGSVFGPCVGSVSLMLSLIFNTKELYLLGLDLAVNQETGATHADEGHVDFQQINLEHKTKLSNVMEYIKNLFPVQGNLTETVYTNSILHASVQSIYRNIDKIKRKDQNIYNLSSGARLYKTNPTDIDDLNTETFVTIDKKELSKSLQTIFSNHSTSSLKEDEVLSIKKRLEYANTINRLLQEYKNSVSHSNKDKYLYDLLGIVSSILHLRHNESKAISYTYLLFFKFSLAITIDLFNCRELKNEKRHIKKIDKMLQDEMFDIIKIYIQALENFIQKRC